MNATTDMMKRITGEAASKDPLERNRNRQRSE